MLKRNILQKSTFCRIFKNTCFYQRESSLLKMRILSLKRIGCCIAIVLSVNSNFSAANEFIETGSMKTARAGHTATLLQNKNVLVTGSLVNTVEIYNVLGRTWSDVASMAEVRFSHSATLLNNGKVLVAGGRFATVLSSSELYNPSTNSWAAAGALMTARYNHETTLLDNGKVLISGGRDSSHKTLASSELYDPMTNSWSTSGAMSFSRANHSQTLLNSGEVLVAGGRDDDFVRAEDFDLSSVDVYNPETNSWRAVASMNKRRAFHSSTKLADGKILVASGAAFIPGSGSSGVQGVNSAEIYDPSTDVWSFTGKPAILRSSGQSILLSDGRVLITGGFDRAILDETDSAELYDSQTGLWTDVGPMANSKVSHTMTLLDDGSILIAGGNDQGGNQLSRADLYGAPVVIEDGFCLPIKTASGAIAVVCF
jgi:N-acetylneuraminic acid mutarotase